MNSSREAKMLARRLVPDGVETDIENQILRRYLAAALNALDFADSEGFEWPCDPLGDEAVAFADPSTALERIASVGTHPKDGDVKQAPAREWRGPQRGDAQMNIDEQLSALGCPYPHSDIQSSFWLLKQVHDNDLFKHSRELCDRFPELLKREAIR